MDSHGSPIVSPAKRVGVYVDAFNLYYGLKSQFEPLGASRKLGWRWLDIQKLASVYAKWSGSVVDRVVYCTAHLNDPLRAQSAANQGVYIEALRATGVQIETGRYTSRSKEMSLTGTKIGAHTPAPVLDDNHEYEWDLGENQDSIRRRGADGMMLARVGVREEKGSDVNVATHLLSDVLTNKVDAAIVITNDSDLALPLRLAREHVPIGLLNPQTKPMAGDLKGDPTSGPGGHWWRRIDVGDVVAAQLPTRIGGVHQPVGW